MDIKRTIADSVQFIKYYKQEKHLLHPPPAEHLLRGCCGCGYRWTSHTQRWKNHPCSPTPSTASPMMIHLCSPIPATASQ